MRLVLGSPASVDILFQRRVILYDARRGLPVVDLISGERSFVKRWVERAHTKLLLPLPAVGVVNGGPAPGIGDMLIVQSLVNAWPERTS